MDSNVQLGVICSLLSPLAWSVAVILFRKTGDHVKPVALNLFKSVLALACFGIVLLLTGERAPEGVEAWHYGLLITSGLIGVGLADLFFLMCLNRIGAGRQAIVNTAYSPPIILLSWLFLGERLSLGQFAGVAMILVAVMLVGITRNGPGEDSHGLRAGILLGVAACLCQAVSIVMVKPFLAEWPLIWTTSWRMLGGLLATVVMVIFTRSENRGLGALKDRAALRVMVPATLIGSCVSLLLWMAGFKYADASVSAALGQTATLYTFVLAVVLLGEPLTSRRVGGLVCGMTGVAFVTFG